MARNAVLQLQKRPDGYKPPNWKQVEGLANRLRQERQGYIRRVWQTKQARRNEWTDVVNHIPLAYRKMLVSPDLPAIRDMIQRIAGLISKSPPMPEVVPPSSREADVSKAAKEEARLHGLRITIEDQQDYPTYEMGIDAQVSWGESWIAVLPDPSAFDDEEYSRDKDEPGEAYNGRYKRLMASGGVPIRFDNYDPQTVLPMRTDHNRYGAVIIESEHSLHEIETGMGYKPLKGADGKTLEWLKGPGTLSEPYVQQSTNPVNGGVVDIDHDTGPSAGADGAPASGPKVKKVIFLDCWTVQTYLDGMKVEQWEHNYGVVPIFPAFGEQSSDRDPSWQSAGVADAAIGVAKQVVMFSAIMASNAMQHGFPTPFLKNPAQSLVDVNGQPLVRTVVLGEMNVLGPNEEIVFPFLDAHMMTDFYRHMDYLTTQLNDSTMESPMNASPDTAGYAIAQLRSMKMAIVSPLYTSAERQWRKIFYFLRHIIRNEFPGGVCLRGAVEEDDEGNQYQPILEYAPDDTTDFTIQVRIEEGIAQDQIAENKMALENLTAGVWSRRRVMEKTGVEDPAAEAAEIDVARIMGSQAMDQQVLQLAILRAAERYKATRTDMSTPFMQALQQAQQTFMGGQGQMQNQGSQPANALPGGQPMQQNPAPDAPQQGGPTAGPAPQPPSMDGLGIPGTPGGVKNQVPAGAPG